MAAVFASQNGVRVAIVESNTTPGRKLLKTGRGRCNITHQHSVNEFLKMCQPYSKFLRHSLYEFSPQEVCDFFKDRNLDLLIEPDGCIFPSTNRSTDVLNVLMQEVKDNQVDFIYGKSVEDIIPKSDHFEIRAANKIITAKAVLIATGGCSWPGTGSTGAGFDLAKSLGHTIAPPRACLIPLVTSDKWIGTLAGVAVPNVKITVKLGKKKNSLTGPVMFTSSGIGGPVILNISRLIIDELKKQSVDLNLDFLPDFTEQGLNNELINRIESSPKKDLTGLLAEILPRSLAEKISNQISPAKSIKANQLTKQNRQKLIQLLKNLTINIVGTRDVSEATVTRGGIITDEIDSKTMESKILPGLFFAGEVIDVDGPCGGYNLQIAWSTGAVAGRNSAEFIKAMI